jgi:cell division control protein 6
MSLFKDMLKDTESLFTSNVEALDFDYLPKRLQFRDKEQEYIASCIKPLFQKRNGRNVFVYGRQGIGKTAAVRHLLNDLEEQTDEIFPIFINCWQKNTSYKIILDICEQLNYKFTQNKKTEELMKVVSEIINKNLGVVFVFDEIDKVEDTDFLYILLEEIYRKSIIIITNYQSWLAGIDDRTRSRLIPDMLNFKEYNEKETVEILRARRDIAFVPNVWDEPAFMLLARKSAEMKDVRLGLFLLREAGQHAEDASKKRVEKSDAEHAVSKLAGFAVKDSSELLEDEKSILALAKEKASSRIGDLFKEYNGLGGSMSYRTFQRKVKKLEEARFITVEKTDGGVDGNTSIIKCGVEKKLTEF